MKVQVNAGDGGCFPIHFDSDPRLDGRLVTAILYLNDEPRGGQLRLYPFPYESVDVEAVAGRLVLFSSAEMLHRVLPSSNERHCLTLWAYASRCSPPARAHTAPPPATNPPANPRPLPS